MPSRVSWDDTWMGVADAVAKRSRCDGAQVGCVLVDADNRPVSTGYNGPPAGFDTSAGPTCVDWCQRQRERRLVTASQQLGQPVTDHRPLTSYGLTCPSVHAEANALLFADRKDFRGGTLYVTAAVCADCSKLISNSGVKRVVMHVWEADAHRQPESSIAFMRKCGLEVNIA